MFSLSVALDCPGMVCLVVPLDHYRSRDNCDTRKIRDKLLFGYSTGLMSQLDSGASLYCSQICIIQKLHNSCPKCMTLWYHDISWIHAEYLRFTEHIRFWIRNQRYSKLQNNKMYPRLVRSGHAISILYLYFLSCRVVGRLSFNSKKNV
jgi:hypothetical protein